MHGLQAIVAGLRQRPAKQVDLAAQGIGRGIISLMLHQLIESNTKRILIEVDNTNANALHLYLSCGFVQESVYDYYRASVDPFLP